MFFFNIIASKNCPRVSLKELKWDYTLPEVVVLAEFTDIRDAFETASYKDQDLKQNN
jgi:hypothetical protein